MLKIATMIYYRLCCQPTFVHGMNKYVASYECVRRYVLGLRSHQGMLMFVSVIMLLLQMYYAVVTGNYGSIDYNYA